MNKCCTLQRNAVTIIKHHENNSIQSFKYSHLCVRSHLCPKFLLWPVVCSGNPSLSVDHEPRFLPFHLHQVAYLFQDQQPTRTHQHYHLANHYRYMSLRCLFKDLMYQLLTNASALATNKPTEPDFCPTIAGIIDAAVVSVIP